MPIFLSDFPAKKTKCPLQIETNIIQPVRGRNVRPSYLRGFLTNAHSFAGFHHILSGGFQAQRREFSIDWPFWVCGNRSRTLVHFNKILSCTLPLGPWRFTLPCLNGSLRPYFPSLYLPKAWKADRVYMTGLCALMDISIGPMCFLCLKSCE